MENERLNEISHEIIGAAIAVHREMGPGLSEEVYELCLMKKLEFRGWIVQRQVKIPLTYKGIDLGKYYLIDILVENCVIVELKATETIIPLFDAQIINYLKLTKLKLGLLINFNVPVLKNGVKRFVNDF